MKRLISAMAAVALSVLLAACGETAPETVGNDAAGDYAFTATLDHYPDVLISAKSLEALNEVVAALSPTTTESTDTTTVSTTVSTTVTQPTMTEPTTVTVATVATTPPTAATTVQDTPSSLSLNATEQGLFDHLVATLYRFTHPAQVKVVKFYAYQESADRYFVSLTSMTDKGGYETKLYSLDESGSCESIFSEFQIRHQSAALGLTTPACDVGAVNRALNEYYTAQGWR